MAGIQGSCGPVLVPRSEMASPRPAGPAGCVATGANRICRALQCPDRRVHFGAGGQGCGPILDIDLPVFRHSGGGRANLCILLLRPGQARPLLAALADAGLSRQLLRQAGLLRTQFQPRYRQSGSADRRRHQYLYPEIPLLSADPDWRTVAIDRLQRRSLVDFQSARRFSVDLCDRGYGGYRSGFRQGSDRPELLPTQA